jgi:hypothetical protein
MSPTSSTARSPSAWQQPHTATSEVLLAGRATAACAAAALSIPASSVTAWRPSPTPATRRPARTSILCGTGLVQPGGLRTAEHGVVRRDRHSIPVSACVHAGRHSLPQVQVRRPARLAARWRRCGDAACNDLHTCPIGIRPLARRGGPPMTNRRTASYAVRSVQLALRSTTSIAGQCAAAYFAVRRWSDASRSAIVSDFQPHAPVGRRTTLPATSRRLRFHLRCGNGVSIRERCDGYCVLHHTCRPPPVDRSSAATASVDQGEERDDRLLREQHL